MPEQKMPPRPAPTPRRISRSASAATATLQERVDELEATLAGLGLERNEAVQQAADYYREPKGKKAAQKVRVNWLFGGLGKTLLLTSCGGG